MANKLEQSLLEKYQKIMAEHGDGPEWAVHQKNNQNCLVKPSIPFVGKNYEKQEKKILVYASAEVLSDYFPGGSSERPWLEDERAITRHRWFFENYKEAEGDFPNIHIQPMNTGTLATAVLYIAEKLNCHDGALVTPREFYETIAVANYGKFTLETQRQEFIRTGKNCEGNVSDRNVDYTQMGKGKAQERLAWSHPFLAADKEVLQPDIVILPQGLYEIDKTFFDGIFGDAKRIELYQMGPIPIQCTISKQYAPAVNLTPSIETWHNKIKGVSKECYRSVYTYIDTKL